MDPRIHLPLVTALSLPVLALGPAGTANAAQTRIDTQLGVCCVKTVINPAAAVSETLTKTSPQGGAGVASAFASVSGGVLKSKVESTSGGLRAPSNSASAYATITDVITVSNAALTGQTGFAHIVVDYNLTFGVAGSSAFADVALRMKWADVRAEVLWQGGISCQLPSQCSETDRRSATWAPDSRTPSILLTFGQPISIDIPIVFGRADDFELFLGGDASTGQRFGEEVSRAFVDGAHSVYWGGVTSVTDSLGNRVQALVSSESGTDYQRSYVPSAVPEPGVATLWFAGLAAVASVARRRRRPQGRASVASNPVRAAASMATSAAAQAGPLNLDFGPWGPSFHDVGAIDAGINIVKAGNVTAAGIPVGNAITFAVPDGLQVDRLTVTYLSYSASPGTFVQPRVLAPNAGAVQLAPSVGTEFDFQGLSIVDPGTVTASFQVVSHPDLGGTVEAYYALRIYASRVTPAVPERGAAAPWATWLAGLARILRRRRAGGGDRAPVQEEGNGHPMGLPSARSAWRFFRSGRQRQRERSSATDARCPRRRQRDAHRRTR